MHERRSSSSRSHCTCACRERTRPISAWWWMRWIFATPSRTSTLSSSSAAIPISRRFVSKLRENDKTVIGVGVKNSSSDLLVANCDEFIFYDDLWCVRNAGRQPPRKKTAGKTPGRWGRRTEGQQRGQDREGAGSGDADCRGADRRARRRREDLGSMSEAGAQAPQTRLQRVLLRVSRRSRSCSTSRESRKMLQLEHDEKSRAYIVKSVAH